MKGILEFDLEERFDREAHARCMKSTQMCLLLMEVSTQIIAIRDDLEEYNIPKQYIDRINAILDQIHEIDYEDIIS